MKSCVDTFVVMYLILSERKCNLGSFIKKMFPKTLCKFEIMQTEFFYLRNHKAIISNSIDNLLQTAEIL